MTTVDVHKIKEDFPLLKDGSLVYLDTAASSQTPTVVLNAMDEYYKEYRANVHRGLYSASEKATEKYEEARGSVAEFIGADTEEIIFTSGATMSSNMLILALENTQGLISGNNIITTVMEHHAALLPLQRYAERTNKTITTIDITSEKELDYDELERQIADDTCIISVTLASNVLGTINDIERITAAARKVSAIVIVDATAAVGHMKVDVKELDVDFLYFSGHKMCGPTGMGVLYGKKELLEQMEPGFLGGGMVVSVSEGKSEWVDSPAKFEAGTPNIAGTIGLQAAIKYLDAIGVDAIHTLITELTTELITELKKIDGVTILTQQEADNNIGIVSLTIDGIHPHDIAHIAGDTGVALRAGHHCAIPLHASLSIPATVRVSLYIYNTKEDVQRLVEAVSEVKKVFA